MPPVAPNPPDLSALPTEEVLTPIEYIKRFELLAQGLEMKYGGKKVWATEWNPNEEGGHAVITDPHDQDVQTEEILRTLRTGPYRVDGITFAGDLVHEEYGKPLSASERLNTLNATLSLIAKYPQINAVVGNHDVCAVGEDGDRLAVEKQGVNQTELFRKTLIDFGGPQLAELVQRCLDALPLAVVVDIKDGKNLQHMIVTHSLPYHNGEAVNLTANDLKLYNPREMRKGKHEMLRRFLFAKPRIVPSDPERLRKEKERQEHLNQLAAKFGCNPETTVWIIGHTVMPEIPIDIQTLTRRDGNCKILPGYNASGMIDMVLFRSNKQAREQHAQALELLSFSGPYRRVRSDVKQEWIDSFLRAATAPEKFGIDYWGEEELSRWLIPDRNGDVVLKFGQKSGPGVIFR